MRMNEKGKYSVKDLKGEEISKKISLQKEEAERVANAKDLIEEELNVKIEREGNILKIMASKDQIEDILKGEEILRALKWGFPPQTALKLRKSNFDFQTVDLKRFRGDLNRIKSRVIGRNGKTKKKIQGVTNTSIIISKRHVVVLGGYEGLKMAIQAIKMIASGRRQQDVYQWLHREKRRRRWP